MSATTDEQKLDEAFEALKTYGYGGNRTALTPIDDAVSRGVNDKEARLQIEARLLAVLKTEDSSLGKEYACRKLAIVGTARSAKPLGELLSDNVLSDMARRALETIAAPQAAKALRDALPHLTGSAKVGVVNSLGAMRDARSVRPLTELLGDSDDQVSSAAAAALGNIGSPRTGRALRGYIPKAPDATRAAVADACLACAERLLASGRKADARAVYQSLADSAQPDPVRKAIEKGLESTKDEGR